MKIKSFKMVRRRFSIHYLKNSAQGFVKSNLQAAASVLLYHVPRNHPGSASAIAIGYVDILCVLVVQ